MDLKVRKIEDIYIIEIDGEMDLYNSYKIKKLTMKMIEKKVRKFIIDMEKVEYIDSSGIGALIYVCSTVKKLKYQLFIANVHGSVKKVIELTKLSGYLPISEDVDDAVKKMS